MVIVEQGVPLVDTIMIIEGKLYDVTIKDLYVDDDSDRLVIKGEICNKTKKEKHDFEEYIVLDEKSGINDTTDVYDN